MTNEEMIKIIQAEFVEFRAAIIDIDARLTQAEERLGGVMFSAILLGKMVQPLVSEEDQTKALKEAGKDAGRMKALANQERMKETTPDSMFKNWQNGGGP